MAPHGGPCAPRAPSSGGALRILAFFPLWTALLVPAPAVPTAPSLHLSEKALTLPPSLEAIEDIQVFTKNSTSPLFGSFHPPTFIPAVRFLRGTTYVVELRFKDGSQTRHELSLALGSSAPPTVTLSPCAKRIPANTLKLYLDFSEPMEQGVFQKHLALYRESGPEVVGAFRETELWSPDGRRLTAMLHPGRQKSGVNLNLEEGPVLLTGERYRLVVSKSWRSSAGIPMAANAVFILEPGPTDHQQPDPSLWKLSLPGAESRTPLLVQTNKLFEPQIFSRALRIREVSGDSTARVVNQTHIEWRFVPNQPWQPGEYTIQIDPDLEDMAGNSPGKPFEIDLSAAPPAPRPTRISLRIPPKTSGPQNPNSGSR